MKKLSQVFLFMILTTGISSAQQQLANPGFELWDTIGDYTQPKNWFTLNPLVSFGFDQTTTLTTDAHTGAFAVMMETKGNNSQNLPGVICSGPLLTPNGNADFSRTRIKFSGSPVRLKFYYKSKPAPNDTCAMQFVLTRWNAVKSKNDTIAMALFSIATQVSNYTLANIPFTYLSPLQPDSAFIIASSSIDGFNPIVGSQFWLDDITLDYTHAGIALNGLKEIAIVYPNPVSDIAHIELLNQRPHTANIFDETGRLVITTILLNQHSLLDFSNFATGFYFLEMYDDSQQSKRIKLLVQH